MRAGELMLTSGRHIRLMELSQELTYEGLLEGLPTAERNAHKLQWLPTSKIAGSSLRAYLVTPVQRPIEYRGKYPFGTPQELPRVTCIGRFTSLDTARDASQDYSSLRIIWFQDEYAFPIDPEVLPQILAVPWNDVAHDLEY
jgi:hypothetical protein